MTFRSVLVLLTSTLISTSCGDGDGDRFEKIAKLRALGVKASPLVSLPSTDGNPRQVTLTFYAATPLGETVTAEGFVDEGYSLMTPVSLVITSGSETVQTHAKLQTYIVQATFTVPPLDAMLISPEQGFARLRYGLRLKSGEEIEDVVGTYVVYPEGAPQLAWADPTQTADLQTEIVSPAANTNASGNIELKASSTKAIDENVRLGWYASSGNIKSRRARETEWEKADKGPQTLIFTARGMTSGAFSLNIVDITIN